MPEKRADQLWKDRLANKVMAYWRDMRPRPCYAFVYRSYAVTVHFQAHNCVSLVIFTRNGDVVTNIVDSYEYEPKDYLHAS